VTVSEPAWTCQCSVDVNVPLRFAWMFLTNVANWVDPPAQFDLDGPFAPGTRGTTRMPGQPPRSWVITDVQPESSFTSEMLLEDGAWFIAIRRFDALPDGRTIWTQRLELRGENAATYVDGCRAGFEPTLEPGMRRIAERMAEADAMT
jgi:hypothetical protein